MNELKQFDVCIVCSGSQCRNAVVSCGNCEFYCECVDSSTIGLVLCFVVKHEAVVQGLNGCQIIVVVGRIIMSRNKLVRHVRLQ